MRICDIANGEGWRHVALVEAITGESLEVAA
jgi:hypothetical protein